MPYNIKFNDCRRPTQIYKYETNALCQHTELTPQSQTAMSVLQKIKNTKLSGHSCQIKTTRWKWYCGVYSHSKVAAIPEVEINEGISPNSCSDMINSQKFVSKNRQSWKLEMNAETVIRVAESGQISDNDDQVQCKGQPTRIGDQLIDNIIVLAQIKVTLREEEFILDGLKMEVLSDHLILDCKPSVGGCRTMDKTFVWARQEIDDCPLRKVRDLRVTEEGDYLIDEESNMVLKKLGPVAAPSGCSSVLLHLTEYEDVYLTSDDTSFLPLGDGMQLATYIEARDDFIIYEAEKRINRLKKKFQKNLCNQRFGQHSDGEIMRVDDQDTFARQAGETTYVFTCEQKEDKIRESSTCYEDIPIGEDESSFVTPVTRLYTRNSNPKPCNPHFPTTVRSEQSWLELRPTPTPVGEPDQMPLDDHIEGKHVDLASGGLYTPSEVKAWENHLESSRFHRNILHQITSGVWRANNMDNIDEPGYTLENLRLPSPLSWFQEMKKTLEQYTAVLCAVVLILEGVKFLTTLAMLAMALVREGIAGLCAVLALLICPGMDRLAKIRRRAKRTRNQTPLIAHAEPNVAEEEL